MQAVILVGGEGTRLRPLTTGIPKPVVTLVDRPFMAYMLEWLSRHGVADVVLACGFKADRVQEVLGDGSRYGVSLTYLEEPEPRGTAGALKFAEEHLQDRFLMLNGDVLTDFDVSAQIAQHERTGATATLGLVEVGDPSAYGLVLCDSDGAVTGFLEKPGPEQLEGVDRYLVSAGIYTLERAVVDLIEPDRKVSIEHVIWPMLVGDGLYGFASEGAYWTDIGTPDRYLEATADILEHRVATSVVARVDGEVHGRASIEGPVIVESGAVIEEGALIAGPAVIGARTTVGRGARIEQSVVLEDCTIGAEAAVRNSILSHDVVLGDDCGVSDQAVLGAGVNVGQGAVLAPGVKLSGGTTVPAGAIDFGEDV